MVMGAVSLLPLTVKVLAAPAVPAIVVPRSSVVALTVMVGVGTALTVPVTVMSCWVAPALVLVRLPVIDHDLAIPVMRTLMVVLATAPTVGVSVTVVV